MSGFDNLRAGQADHLAGRFDEAEAAYRRALEDPSVAGDPNLRSLLARFFVQRGDDLPVDQAIDRYCEAVCVDPSFGMGWLRLGHVLARSGDIRASVAALRNAVDHHPRMALAYRLLAEAGQDDVAGTMEALLAAPDLPRDDAIALHFGLAKIMDRAGRWDDAFRHVRAGNALLRETDPPFEMDGFRAYVDTRIDACDQDFFRQRADWGNSSELPVFIVGMPRSGTTLVEQILSSHSAVKGIGEGPWTGGLGAELERHELTGRYGGWDADTCRQVADRHVGWLTRQAGGAIRVVDKTPDNVFHLGMLACLFPRAHIIACRRDPRDVCLSCYFQPFLDPMPYANDLGSCAFRAAQTERMMEHWRGVLPVPMITVDYESIVADLETEARRIIGFLGLEWQNTCLNFHRTKRVVETASLWQVRRPLYPSSVGRWKHYRDHLQPVLSVFPDS